jgi:hypothetical protein
MMKKTIKFSLLLLAIMFNGMTYAQPGNGTGGGGLEGNDPPPAPIDTLVIVAAIIGTLFVFNVFKQQNKKA